MILASETKPEIKLNVEVRSMLERMRFVESDVRGVCKTTSNEQRLNRAFLLMHKDLKSGETAKIYKGETKGNLKVKWKDFAQGRVQKYKGKIQAQLWGNLFLVEGAYSSLTGELDTEEKGRISQRARGHG